MMIRDAAAVHLALGVRVTMASDGDGTVPVRYLDPGLGLDRTCCWRTRIFPSPQEEGKGKARRARARERDSSRYVRVRYLLDTDCCRAS